MIDLRKLRVRPGEPVLPAWNRLLDWAKQFRLYAGRGVRLQRTPNGTYVIADLRTTPWNHPFKVSLADREVTVAFGTVQDVVPRIGGRAIDEPVPVPRLRLDGGPDKDGRSWVVIEVKVNGKSGEIDPKDKDAVLIRLVSNLDRQTANVGRHPLAMLIWDAGRTSVIRVRQITHFDLRHLYVKAEGKPGRHIFWAT
ncbi:MAG: hypothetical protein DVB23_001683 [Verrucomicrobia bacterium]|nr:MAG: hypothetical protein DVB23_001683 [Verrucomicrobiota bacterium]